MTKYQLKTTNGSDDVFSDFYARQAPDIGPGWYVFGRNSEKYGTKADGKGMYVMLCARPDVAERKHPNYNGKIRRGWHRKHEAEQVAHELNAKAARIIRDWCTVQA